MAKFVQLWGIACDADCVTGQTIEVDLKRGGTKRVRLGKMIEPGLLMQDMNKAEQGQVHRENNEKGE